MNINTHLALLPAGYLFAEVANRVEKYSLAHPDKKILKLGIGDATLPLPKAVAEEFSKAALEMATPEGFRGYPPYRGYDFLIDAILAGDYAPLHVDLSREEIFVSDGAKTDTGAVQELFSPDAKIAVTDPVYPVYVDTNAMAGRLGAYQSGAWERLTCLPCNAENGFVPDVPKQRVDVIYLCYPNNPTGTTLTRGQLQKFVDYANANDSLIIYDAAYKAFITSDNVPRSIYELPGAKDCAIECCSFSKTVGFTGVRCGYMVIPKGLKRGGASLNALWQRRIATKSNGVSYPVQRAAAASYTPEGDRQKMENIRYYLENARAIREGLRGAGYEVYGGVDAPYVWMKTPRGMKSWDFFDLLLREIQVVGTPGEGFGAAGEGYFRLTAFNTHENTAAAVARMTAMG